jgi:hypothetical protein
MLTTRKTSLLLPVLLGGFVEMKYDNEDFTHLKKVSLTYTNRLLSLLESTLQLTFYKGRQGLPPHAGQLKQARPQTSDPHLLFPSELRQPSSRLIIPRRSNFRNPSHVIATCTITHRMSTPGNMSWPQLRPVDIKTRIVRDARHVVANAYRFNV